MAISVAIISVFFQKFRAFIQPILRQVYLRDLSDVFCEKPTALALTNCTGSRNVGKGNSHGIILLNKLNHIFENRKVCILPIWEAFKGDVIVP